MVSLLFLLRLPPPPFAPPPPILPPLGSVFRFPYRLCCSPSNPDTAGGFGLPFAVSCLGPYALRRHLRRELRVSWQLVVCGDGNSDRWNVFAWTVPLRPSTAASAKTSGATARFVDASRVLSKLPVCWDPYPKDPPYLVPLLDQSLSEENCFCPPHQKKGIFVKVTSFCSGLQLLPSDLKTYNKLLLACLFLLYVGIVLGAQEPGFFETAAKSLAEARSQEPCELRRAISHIRSTLLRQ